MNKVAIKNFAIEARKKLIASVKDKAGRIGITKDKITKPLSEGEGFAIFPTHIGIEAKLSGKELVQRENLVSKIKSRENGYELVMEEVAYTWFNRIIAVRFMEVNDYLPSRIRVLSSETKGKFEPDIVTQAPNIDLNLTQQEIHEIISLKEKNEMDQLFKFLFIKQSNELGKILPELFENTSKQNNDYTEILLDISYTNQDGVIRDLLTIDEEDFLDAVEIIGWMYQYYNTEPKAIVDAYNGKKKVPKEDVPAKTQLFTPDWIVRYMVENSVGRLWLEGHPNNVLKSKWDYYLEEAEQESYVTQQLEKIKEDYRNLKPEEIKLIDPCMGSGHILVYAFEVIMNIYVSCGYSERDAASLIISNNIYGLDIDDRAYQLAYFAVMMKGRKYDRRFFTRQITPNLCAIQESNGINSFEDGAKQISLDDIHVNTANYLIETFKDAKEYGSIIEVVEYDYDSLLNYIEKLKELGTEDLFMSLWINNVSNILPPLIKQAKILMTKYDVVITNPPYFSGSDMSPKLSTYIKKKFPKSKSDMFAVFMEKGFLLSKTNAFSCMVTMQSWMFLSSYEKFRENIVTKNTISHLMHMGNNVMGIAFGTAVSIIRNGYISCYKGVYNRIDMSDIGPNSDPINFPSAKNRFNYVSSNNFEKIPAMPIVYWMSEKLLACFENGHKLGEIAYPRQGMATTNNNRFLRQWFEVANENIGFNLNSEEETIGKRKWFPYNKGGSFRKWYGNNDYVVNFKNKGKEICDYIDSHSAVDNKGRVINRDRYFKECITWSKISSGKIAFRYKSNGFIFDVAGTSIFGEKDEILPIMAIVNSKVGVTILNCLSPTLNYEVGHICAVPIIESNNYKLDISEIVDENIKISKNDWDSYETSWDFSKNPLIEYVKDINENKKTLSLSFNLWKSYTEQQFNKLKSNEEKLNRIFIDIYDLQGELTPEVEDKDITIRKADLGRDIRNFISYAVGCMLGRYSLDIEGLAYAGGEWDASKYSTFAPEKDNIITITEEEYFTDDIVSRLAEFIKVVYGQDTLEENLDYIAEALGNKGNTSREVIRNYFIKDFHKDHIKIYQKRPIYWLFDSGKENGFKALIYMHRYNEDTVGRVRADYLHKMQAAIENAIAHCDVVLESSTSAGDKAKAVKQKTKLIKQLSETRIYDQAIAHIAHKRIPIDLDDGVKVNYEKFQGIEVANEGKKTVKIDLLGKI